MHRAVLHRAIPNRFFETPFKVGFRASHASSTHRFDGIQVSGPFQKAFNWIELSLHE